MRKIRVAINGYGVIGKRVADAVQLQDDMEISGICDVTTDWQVMIAVKKKYPVFAATVEAHSQMKQSGIPVVGKLQDLIAMSDLIVDCTPKRFSAPNAALYRQSKIKFIVQGGDIHETTGHSFNAEVNYDSAINRECTRVVSCNTTSIIRTLSALKTAGLLRNARGTLLRRATDPWESHLGGIMNTLVPEKEVPSHQSPDAKSVDPELDVLTVAVKVPETLSHLHAWHVLLTKKAGIEEVIHAFRHSSRIKLINYSDGLVSNNTVKEYFLNIGRPRGDMYEVALWQDTLFIKEDELFYSYLVDNQAIVIPENIDAIRALMGIEKVAKTSIKKTDLSLGIDD